MTINRWGSGGDRGSPLVNGPSSTYRLRSGLVSSTNQEQLTLDGLAHTEV